MEHKQLEATPTATDTEHGTFTALVSAWNVDRERDVIARTAFDKTIAAWQRSGKRLPLLFEHGTTEVGAIDPHSMHATDEGLVVAGEVDRETEPGQQVWRSIKRGTIGFSIGYIADGRPRNGGGRELYEIDLLEISATSKPMNAESRVIDWKTADAPDLSPDVIEFHDIVTESIDKAVANVERQQAEKRKAAETRRKARRSRPIRVETFDVG